MKYIVQGTIGLVIFFSGAHFREYTPQLEPGALVQIFGILVILIAISGWGRNLNRRKE